MRISLRINFYNNGLHVLPNNYRINIVSLIKEALSISDMLYFKELYDGNTQKPFTFSVLIPGAKSIKNDKGYSQVYFYGSYIKLFISSLDNVFIEKFINGIQILNNKYTPFKQPVYFSNLENEKEKIVGEKVVFTLVSPCIVRKTVNKKCVGYLSYKDKEFDESLSACIDNCANNFLDKKFDYSFDFSKCRKIKVSAYGVMEATVGSFLIAGNSELLNLVYHIGIGAKRNLGFGMVL